MRFLDRLQPLALLVLRLVIGVIMVTHGYAKVTGFSHVVGMLTHLGIPAWLAYPLTATEFLGGMLMIVGLLTRCVAVAMLTDMSVAIWKLYWHNGSPGFNGVEFPIAAIAFALIFFGAGPISADHIIRGSGGGSIKAKK